MTFKNVLRSVLAVMFIGLTSAATFADATKITITDDPGGEILTYAIRLATYKEGGNHVEFSGRCDSACTMLMALPSTQTCITPNASFRFHAPFGGTVTQEKIALQMLYKKYPKWVQQWIDSNGGLTEKFIAMNFDYAKNHMTQCPLTVAGF